MENKNFEHQKVKKSIALYKLLKKALITVLAFFGLFGAVGLFQGEFAVVIALVIVSIPFVLILKKITKKEKSVEAENAAAKRFNEEADERKAEFMEQNENKEYFSCGKLQAPGTKPFCVTEKGVFYGNSFISYENIQSIKLVTAPTVALPGVAEMLSGNKNYQLTYLFKDRERAVHAIESAISYLNKTKGTQTAYKYRLVAHTGTSLEVYDTYFVLNYMRTGGLIQSLSNTATGGGTGNKQIDFADLTSVQFKEPSGIAVGFIQFAYPGSTERRGGILNAVDDENAVPVSAENLELARSIVSYIEAKRRELRSRGNTVVQEISVADELKKFKSLLDEGVLTQEEFNEKKKQLLGI